MSRIIKPAELQRRSLQELHAMLAEVNREITQSASGSAERRNALASHENLSRAIARKLAASGPRF